MLSKHFTENEQLHDLDKSSPQNFDESLKNNIEITILEKVKIPDHVTDTYERLRYCETRERIWRDRLRTLEDYGGLNIREEKKMKLLSRQP